MEPTQPIQVLLVEDSPTDVLLAQEALEEGQRFRLIHTERLGKALDLLRSDDFNVVLLDLGLPDSQGLDTLLQLRRSNPVIAIIVMTGLDDEELALRAVQEGAQDYLVKSQLQANTLARAIRYATERSRIEQSLRYQREELQVTLASIGDAVVVTDNSGVVTFLNPVAEALTGWQQQEAVGQPLETVFRIVNEATRQPIENPVSKVLQQGVTVGLANHTVLLAKDGREIPIDNSGAPIRSSEGAMAGVVLVFRDVTERRRALEARLHLAAIVESSADAIISKALDGTIVSWNQGAQRLYQYTAEEVVGRPISILIPANAPDELPAIMGRLRQGERIEHFETVRVRKDGQRVEVSVSISPIRNADGQVVAASAIARDISERRRVDQLVEADRLKDEFLAMLAHELRNPLAPIPNAIQVLEDFSPADADLQWARDVIERQVRHMTRLVDDLLDVSRINRGKITLQKERLKLAQVVADAVEIARPHIEARRHQLTVSEPPDPLWLDGDSTRLTQVVANLVNNAAKYMQPGGHIWLTVEKEGEEAVVRVRDTGIGIAPEKLSDIFGLFTQLDRSLDRSQGGLGIGLTLARRLVEMHGGSIHARSDGPGQGSEFVVRLPTLGQIKEVRETSEPSSPALAAPPSRRILIADDNEDFAEMTARLLRRKGGHEVTVVYDGLTALEAAQTFRPDVAFLDIGLPGMNGYELAQRLRQLPGCESVLLVALTGYGQEEDRRRALAAGFDEHLTKPVRYDTLQRLLGERMRIE